MIRLLLADDHALFRSGVRLLIQTQPDLEVVGEAATGREAIHMARDLSPDVIVLDLVMPAGGGIGLIRILLDECPRSRIVVVSMHDEAPYLHASLAAGGTGYLAKSAADTELLTAIRAVHAGQVFVDLPGDEDVIGALSDAKLRRRTTHAHPIASLSSRERQVLILLGHGYTNQETAKKLFLSVKTVETYRTRIGQKLGLRSRADFVRMAVEMGLLTANSSGIEDEFA